VGGAAARIARAASNFTVRIIFDCAIDVIFGRWSHPEILTSVSVHGEEFL
jgi:hypothetical protein